MSTTTLTRLSGLALMAAFALTLIGGILHPVIGGDSHAAPSLAQPFFPTAHLLVFLGEICLLMGLPALYASIAPRTGLLGLSGFVLYFFARHPRQLRFRLRGVHRSRVGRRPCYKRSGDPRRCHPLLGSVRRTARGRWSGVYAGARAIGHRSSPLPGDAKVDRGTDGRFSDFPVATDTGGARPYRPADRATTRTRGGGYGIHALPPRGQGACKHPGSSVNLVEEKDY